MNPVFTALLGISFAGAFAIGFFTKRYLSLILSLLFGLGVAAFSFWLFFVLPSTQKIGLAVIALIPVTAIIFGALNVLASLLGGIIGTFIGKRKSRSQPPI
ncbi:MAG: hypothetical protein Q8Q97_02245 [bacterium]|nr:hypothetical protein [bacterium]